VRNALVLGGDGMLYAGTGKDMTLPAQISEEWGSPLTDVRASVRPGRMLRNQLSPSPGDELSIANCFPNRED
jgi:hypothetical protein